MEYEFVGKLMIPRIARVCKVGDSSVYLHISLRVLCVRVKRRSLLWTYCQVNGGVGVQ